MERLKAIVDATDGMSLRLYGRGRHRTLELSRGSTSVKTHFRREEAGQAAEELARFMTLDCSLPLPMQAPVPPHLRR